MRIGETMREADWQAIACRAAGILALIVGVLLTASLCGASTPADHPVPSIFDPRSTPAESIRHLSYFVLGTNLLSPVPKTSNHSNSFATMLD